MIKLKDQVYTGSGIGTVIKLEGNHLKVTVTGKGLKTYHKDEVLPVIKELDEKTFRKKWTEGHKTFSWYSQKTGNRGVISLYEIQERLGR